MWWVMDVHYEEDRSRVAGIGVDALHEAEGVEVVMAIPGAPAPYEPGQFYKRELPLLAAFLRDKGPIGVVVDGFVWLAPGREGLGAILHWELGVPVIGVAKRGFKGAEAVAEQVVRGDSDKPLWVTSVEAPGAGERVRTMHGPFRLPTLLKRVDQLCRGLIIPGEGL